MIDTRLGYTRFPNNKSIQGVYWPKISKLPIAREADIQVGQEISPLKATLFNKVGALVDVVLLTLPEFHINQFREGAEPPFYTRHQLGPIHFADLPSSLTTRTTIDQENFVHGGIPGFEGLGSVGHLRLMGEHERLLTEGVDRRILNTARREDAVDLMGQQWLLNYIREAGISGNNVMPFTRLAGLFIGFHLPHLKAQDPHPWL